MGFSGRVINGALRYRVLNSFKDYLNQESEVVKSMASKLKIHPCYLNLPPLSLPAQLDGNAIAYLRENSSTSPKGLENYAKSLTNFLWSRELMSKVRFNIVFLNSF